MHKKIGRYEVLGELGQGAMGIVYKGKDPRIGRVVALKTIHPGTALSKDEQKEFYERFYREAQTAGNLSHPNIVTIFDADEDHEAKISFIAMEFIEGQSLQQLLDGDKIFTPAETLQIVVQIADGLGYAHRNGIIHRDIKPANVILTPDNRVKITDFGIARIESSSLTRTGQFLGTPYYMAPEQIAGGQIDGRSDLFSLAVVFYQLLTREKPFSGNNITTILYKIVNQEPLPATRLNIGLAAGFDLVLMRGLAKSPENRYQDAEQFAADLRQLMEGKPPLHAGAEATLMVSQTAPGAQTIDASQLASPAPSSGPATAAVSAVSAPAGPAPAIPPAKKSKSHATLIGFAAALTVVVIFLVSYLAFFSGRSDSPSGQQPEETPEYLMAQRLGEGGEAAAIPGGPAAGEPGEAGEIIEPPAEQPVAAAAAKPLVRTEPEKVADRASEQQTGQQAASARTAPPPAKETPVVTQPVTGRQEPPATTSRETSRQEQQPARPREISQNPPAGKESAAKPASTGPAGETPAESVPAETVAAPPPVAAPQDFGALDVVFKHSFQAGRLTIRADGTEVYSKSFGGGDSGGWKGLLSKVKKTTFEEFGIEVPVGRYPLEVKVTVPGKDISPVSISARFKTDQERCLSIKSKLLINRDEIEVRWGCEDDDDDDDDDDDKDKKKDDDD